MTSTRKNLQIMDASSEHTEQVWFFRWLKVAHPKVWGVAYAVPNGGYRSPMTAANLREEGVKSGVPDICIPVIRVSRNNSSPALYIEMKRKGTTGKPKGTLTQPQKEFMVKLIEAGNSVRLCYGSEEAEAVVNAYLIKDYEADFALYDDRLNNILGLVNN